LVTTIRTYGLTWYCCVRRIWRNKQCFWSLRHWFLPEKEGLPLFLRSRRTSGSTNSLNVLSQTQSFLLEL
jgi:hypothetical protein